MAAKIRSGNSRGFDPTLPSNRFVLGGSVVAGAAGGFAALVAGERLAEAAGWGVASGGGFFIAWALARELHPDRPGVAAVAALLAPVFLLLDRPKLLSSGVVLLVARLVAGTTGRRFQWVDALVLVVLAGLSIGTPVGTAVLAVAAAATGATWFGPGRRGPVAISAFALAFLAAWSVAISEDGVAGGLEAIDGGVALFGLAAIAGPVKVVTGTDREGGVIHPGRVRAARVFAAGTVAASAALGGVGVLGPVAAALIGTALRPR